MADTTRPMRAAGAPAVPIAALLLALAVGLAFADTSIVMLGLPEMYVELDTSILGVSLVATAYNVVVAVAAFAILPLVRRGRPAPIAAAGLALFAATSVGAGLADSLVPLVAWRAAQGLGAALLLAAALPLLVALTGSATAGRAWWALAGTVGAAVGPALGGVLTELFDWRAIFLAQAPVAALAFGAALAPASRRVAAEGRPPATTAESRRAGLALVFTFGGLVGALFLAVIMVVTVWDLGPLAGAIVVSALPLAAVAVRPVSARVSSTVGAAAGTALLALGLLGLALLPSAEIAWAVGALVVCGIGFGLAVPPLTGASVADMHAPAGSGTISVGVRHVGLVLGLIVIAPLLAADLDAGGARATLDATAVVLDSPLPLEQKVPIAQDLAAEFARTPDGEIPDLTGAFEANGAGADPRVAAARDDLSGAIEDALTGAFRDSYLAAAAIALVGLVVVGTGVRARGPIRIATPASAAVAGLLVLGGGLVVAEVAAGGGGLGRTAAVDPCAPRAEARQDVEGVDATLQRVALDGLDGAACELGVSREALVLSLAPEAPGAPDIGWDRETIEQATRTGLVRAVDAAEDRGEIDGTTAVVLRETSRRLPVEQSISAVQGARDILDEADGDLDRALDLLRGRLGDVSVGDVLRILDGLRP